MSQGFHKGNIFSFSDDDDEFDHQRPQQNHIAQQSRRDKLRVQQHGLFDAAAATGHPPLVAIQEEADQEEDVGIYGPAGTSNMLISEMFNFPAPAFGGLLHHGHTAGLHQGSTDAVMSYHRLIQLQRPADSFYGRNSRADQLQLHHNIITPASSTTWSSVVLADECLNLVGGEVMERQLGASQLSLSSSELQQLEMRRRAENQMRVISRSEQAGGDHSFFFLNSASSNINEHQEDELPAPQPFLHQQACHQQGQQAHNMSYGPVAALSIFRNSLYARAAQELLEEFCSVGRERLISSGINNKGAGRSTNSSFNPPAYNPTHIRGGTAASSSAAAAASSSAAAASSSSSKEIPPLSSADRFEGQRKKSKLLSMLDEVERRYNHYCEQMQMVVNSFESAMGLGAATPYTALAHKAMSRHFRCLKDGIAGQLKKTCELLGDKETGALLIFNGSGGLTKVETPKLRLIDQSLRQQRAFHHHHNLGMMEQQQQQQDQPGYWRPQRGLPDRSVTMLRAWLFDHFLHPYPSDADKHLLARQTGLSRNQVSNWFINARVRLWKPMVEDMYQKEAKEAEDSQQQQQQQQHNNDDDHDQTIINSHTSIILSAATTRQLHDHSISPPAQNPTLLILHTPEYSASPECVPMPRQNLRSQIVAPINSNPQPPQPPEDDMYRRPAALLGRPSTAASQARTTGDLSLTLGLRHAGSVNPPETAAGRFVGL